MGKGQWRERDLAIIIKTPHSGGSNDLLHCSSRSVFVLSSFGSDYDRPLSLPRRVMTSRNRIHLQPLRHHRLVLHRNRLAMVAHCLQPILAGLGALFVYLAQSDLHLPFLLSNVSRWLIRSRDLQSQLLIGPEAVLTLVVLT